MIINRWDYFTQCWGFRGEHRW